MPSLSRWLVPDRFDFNIDDPYVYIDGMLMFVRRLTERLRQTWL